MFQPISTLFSRLCCVTFSHKEPTKIFSNGCLKLHFCNFLMYFHNRLPFSESEALGIAVILALN